MVRADTDTPIERPRDERRNEGNENEGGTTHDLTRHLLDAIQLGNLDHLHLLDEPPSLLYTKPPPAGPPNAGVLSS
jgi:hypothetical protein